jgi:hypothetical protein
MLGQRMLLRRVAAASPYNAKLCLNGNHCVQRQAAKAGIGFTPMDKLVRRWGPSSSDSTLDPHPMVAYLLRDG